MNSAVFYARRLINEQASEERQELVAVAAKMKEMLEEDPGYAWNLRMLMKVPGHSLEDVAAAAQRKADRRKKARGIVRESEIEEAIRETYGWKRKREDIDE